MSEHSADIDTDEDGWWWAACVCGWINGPFPDRETATDDYGDHRVGSSGTETTP